MRRNNKGYFPSIRPTPLKRPTTPKPDNNIFNTTASKLLQIQKLEGAGTGLIIAGIALVLLAAIAIPFVVIPVIAIFTAFSLAAILMIVGIGCWLRAKDSANSFNSSPATKIDTYIPRARRREKPEKDHLASATPSNESLLTLDEQPVSSDDEDSLEDLRDSKYSSTKGNK